jgi:hypothetical protein
MLMREHAQFLHFRRDHARSIPPTAGDTLGADQQSGSIKRCKPFPAVILPSSSAFVTCLKDCSVRTVTTLPGDSPARTAAALPSAAAGRSPGYAR